MPWDAEFGPFGLPSGLTLTNNDLTVERPGGAGLDSVVGTRLYTTVNKRYFEIRLDSTRTAGVNRARIYAIGIANTIGTGIGICQLYYDIYSTRVGYNVNCYQGTGLESQVFGTNSIIRTPKNPDFFNQGEFRASTLPSFTQGDLIQCAVDGDMIWFGVNDVWDGDPFAGTGGDTHGVQGLIAPLWQTNEDPTIATAKFNPPFDGTVPTGFIGWEEEVLLAGGSLHLAYSISNPGTGLITGTQYRARLTGEGNNVSDLVLPISSFSASKSADSEDSVSVVVPNGVVYSDAVAERQLGQIIVEQYYRREDGAITDVRQVALTEYDSLQMEQAPRTHRITLAGRKAIEYQSNQTHSISQVISKNNNQDSRSAKLALDLNINPGDTADFEEEAWTVANVRLSANATSGSDMEISDS